MLTTANYTLAIDALALMLKQSSATTAPNILTTAPAELIQSGNTKLHLLRNPGHGYRFAYEVEIDNNNFGTLHIHSYRSEAPLMKLTISNHVLYTDFLTPFNRFTQDFSLTINNLTRLDIAADTSRNLVLWFLNYYEQPELYEYRVSNKQREHILTFAKEYRNGIYNKSLYPYKVEGRSLRIYNKTKEIADKDNEKYYINDYHKANGLPGGQDIYRAEISLTSTVLKTHEPQFENKNDSSVISLHRFTKLPEPEKQYYRKVTQINEPVDFYRLQDSTYLADVFNRFAGSLIEFRAYDNASVTRRTRTRILELKNPRPLTPLTRLTLPAAHARRNNLHAIKVLVQQSYALALPALLESAGTLAAKAGLTDRLAGFIELYRPAPRPAPIPAPFVSLPL